MSEYTGAPLPDNEFGRLAALKDSGIQPGTDADFDNFTDIAKDVFDVPVALITFVDADKQWFKACYGTDLRETPRSAAFCGYTILQDEALVVLDALEDPRFVNNPLVTNAPHLRFYAGAPIYSREGYKIGSLCLLDMKPRASFSDKERAILKKMALAVSNMMLAKDARFKSDQTTDAKTDFLLHISHELRTPLNAVIGIANILRLKTDLDQKTTGMVRTLHIASESLLELINSVLDLSAIESRNYGLAHETFSWDELLLEIEAIIGSRANEKNLRFAVQAQDVRNTNYEGDRLRIKQVLINLLGNAIKFTDEGSVSLKVSKQDEMIHIEVIDTGIGIPPAKIDTIFGRFVQAHEMVGQYQSTGLGLAITKELVEMMGGTVSVANGHERGAIFTIRLPDRTSAKDVAPVMQHAEIQASNSKIKVLMAEDYAPNILVTTYFLEDLGYNVDSAEDGVEVLEKCRVEAFDIILMDINMPEMDGIEVTKVLRQDIRYKNTPIIGMSAHIFEKERMQCFEAGMNEYVTKPINYQELHEKIQRLASGDLALDDAA